MLVESLNKGTHRLRVLHILDPNLSRQHMCPYVQQALSELPSSTLTIQLQPSNAMH